MNTLDVSVIVVSFNTRELTLAALRSLHEQTRALRFETIVVDNASSDGSAEAIAAAFPRVRLVASGENLGFARANNLAAQRARGELLLLLNPDTVILDRAVERLVAFARRHPEAGIWGGRTQFGDGALNPTSCWRRPSPWSMFALALGIATLGRQRPFDTESYGRWQRDSVRQVDIVTGCFLLITRELWTALGGFDPAFWMYGEEADLCLRAAAQGARPLFDPDARIVHHGGRSPNPADDALVNKMKARRLILHRHWPPAWRGFGRAMQVLWLQRRRLVFASLGLLGSRGARERARVLNRVWARRAEWSLPDPTGSGPAPAQAAYP